jgi:hypothetical protein
MDKRLPETHKPESAGRGLQPEEGLNPSFPSSGILSEAERAQLNRIEAMLDRIIGAFNIRENSPAKVIPFSPHDTAEFKRACRDLGKGNKETMKKYLDRGSRIPRHGG